MDQRFEVTTISAGVNNPVEVTVRDTETASTATAVDQSVLMAREKAIRALTRQP